MGKVSKDKRDIYYRKAKEEGWRARSAFKLIHINEKFNIFYGVKKVVDLCAAPGGWSQVLSKRLYQQNCDEVDSQCASSSTSAPSPSTDVSEKHEDEVDSQCASSSTSTPSPSTDVSEKRERNDGVKIVAVDLQPMAPLPGVIQIQGDITKHTTAQEIISHFDGEKADLVICDGAPDVTGLHCIDIYLQSQLLLGALHIACTVMQKGATFVAKIFRSNESDFLIQNQLLILFRSVTITKPMSSRNSSIEAFVVCKYYDPPTGFDPSLIASYLENPNVSFEDAEGINKLVIPFLVCGDVPYDADANYPLNITEDHKYTYVPPVQLPLDPPYKAACSNPFRIKTQSFAHDKEKLSTLNECLRDFGEHGDFRPNKLKDLFKVSVNAEEPKCRVPYPQGDLQNKGSVEPNSVRTEEAVSHHCREQSGQKIIQLEDEEACKEESVCSSTEKRKIKAKKMLEDYHRFVDEYKKDPRKFIAGDDTYLEEFADFLDHHLHKPKNMNNEEAREKNNQDSSNSGDPIYEELLACVKNLDHCCESERSVINHIIASTL